MQDQLKKDTSWTINNYGSFGIESLKREVSNFDKEWLIDTSRQDNNVTHKNTNMFQIIYSDYRWIAGQSIEPIVVNRMNRKESNKELALIFEGMEKYFNGKVVRAEFIKMLENVKIRKHVDGGDFLQYARRCHVPIITNENVLFTVLDNTVNMQEGGWYEINNSLPHSVENNSDKYRVHLIVDIMPLEML